MPDEGLVLVLAAVVTVLIWAVILAAQYRLERRKDAEHRARLEAAERESRARFLEGINDVRRLHPEAARLLNPERDHG